jgi:hypothetical protein
MIILSKLLFIAVSLFMFINLFLTDLDDKKNRISYKIYLFLFIFILNFMFQIFSNLLSDITISINELIEMSINNALLAVVAFSIYIDLDDNNFFAKETQYQKSLVLILLIIGFITTIKILELLISSN